MNYKINQKLIKERKSKKWQNQENSYEKKSNLCMWKS